MRANDRIGERVGTSTRRLSLAVRPIDAYRGARATGDLCVRIPDRPSRPVPTPSGHYLFFDLDAAESEPVTVVVTGGEHYLPGEGSVSLTELDPLSPLLEISLLPAPSYPFPAWTTLVRGRVRTEAGEPIVDATVTVSGGAHPGRTDARGEFVVAMPTLDPRDVIEEDGRRIVAPAGDPLVATAAHPTLDRASDPTEVMVAEGEQAAVALTIDEHD